MNPPLFSIAVPSLNSAASIERAVRSLLNQNYPSLELLFADGGSTDDTLRIIEPYRPCFQHWIVEPDRGQADALNKAFRRARGDLRGWLCADDELAEGALHRVAALFHQHPEADLLTGGCLRVFADGTRRRTVPGPRILERIGYFNGIEQPSTFWRADLHRRAGELDESLPYAFDWAWWNQLKHAGAYLTSTPETLSRYHFTATNRTSRGGQALARDLYQVVKRFGPLRGRLADIYWMLFRVFDLRGCYDRPRTASPARQLLFRATLTALRASVGKELVRSYNWQFAAKQQRGLCWWR